MFWPRLRADRAGISANFLAPEVTTIRKVHAKEINETFLTTFADVLRRVGRRFKRRRILIGDSAVLESWGRCYKTFFSFVAVNEAKKS